MVLSEGAPANICCYSDTCWMRKESLSHSTRVSVCGTHCYACEVKFNLQHGTMEHAL